MPGEDLIRLAFGVLSDGRVLLGDAFEGRLAQIQLALIRLPNMYVY